MKRSYNISSFLLLQITIGIYFSVKGLIEIIGFNSGVVEQAISSINKLAGKSNYWPLVIAIVFLVAGIALISGVIFSIRKRLIYFIILVLWIIFIVNGYFVNNFLKGGTLVWIREISLQLVILSGLWGITQNN